MDAHDTETLPSSCHIVVPPVAVVVLPVALLTLAIVVSPVVVVMSPIALPLADVVPPVTVIVARCCVTRHLVLQIESCVQLKLLM
jgi:hypothetical protein